MTRGRPCRHVSRSSQQIQMLTQISNISIMFFIIKAAYSSFEYLIKDSSLDKFHISPKGGYAGFLKHTAHLCHHNLERNEKRRQQLHLKLFGFQTTKKKKIKQIAYWQVYSNLWKYQYKYGKVFPWIQLQDYPPTKGIQSSW